MPTYEYRCPNGHDFDHFFGKISDGVAVWPCPVCGLPAERRMSGGAGLVFRGSGFYITDYGKDGKKDQRTAGASDSTKPAAATDGKESGAGSAATGANAPAASPPPSGAGSGSSSEAPKPAGGTGKSRTKKSE
jgi:putative FmdB family regulatory protein